MKIFVTGGTGYIGSHTVVELQQNGYEVHVAARNNLAEKNGLSMKYADKVFDRHPA